MLEQIKKDSETTTVPSLAAKWVPREKTRFGDMFADLATTYFSNYIKKHNVECLDGKIIGVKDKKNAQIMLEDLMENKKIALHHSAIGVYIPHNELIKRTKYNWFCSLSAQEVLECDVFISYYMRT